MSRGSDDPIRNLQDWSQTLFRSHNANLKYCVLSRVNFSRSVEILLGVVPAEATQYGSLKDLSTSRSK